LTPIVPNWWGLSFCIKPGEGWYVPCLQDQEATMDILEKFIPLFADPSKFWVGQNIKYDFLMLKWYGIEPAGEIY
jgi:DNA polymerase-1